MTRIGHTRCYRQHKQTSFALPGAHFDVPMAWQPCQFTLISISRRLQSRWVGNASGRISTYHGDWCLHVIAVWVVQYWLMFMLFWYTSFWLLPFWWFMFLQASYIPQAKSFWKGVFFKVTLTSCSILISLGNCHQWTIALRSHATKNPSWTK